MCTLTCILIVLGKDVVCADSSDLHNALEAVQQITGIHNRNVASPYIY